MWKLTTVISIIMYVNTKYIKRRYVLWKKSLKLDRRYRECQGGGSCSVKKVVSVDLIDEVRFEQGTKGGKAQMSPWREGRHSFSSLHLISSTLYSSGLISLS